MVLDDLQSIRELLDPQSYPPGTWSDWDAEIHEIPTPAGMTDTPLPGAGVGVSGNQQSSSALHGFHPVHRGTGAKDPERRREDHDRRQQPDRSRLSDLAAACSGIRRIMVRGHGKTAGRIRTNLRLHSEFAGGTGKRHSSSESGEAPHGLLLHSRRRETPFRSRSFPGMEMLTP